MKFRRLAAGLLALLLLCCSSCGAAEGQKKTVAVIVKATGSDFWNNVRSGVNSAAIEYNVAVTFEGPEREEDYLKQNEMIAKAVEDGVDAIVLSAIDYNQCVPAVTAAADAGIRIITIDSAVNTDKTDVIIGTNNYEAGREAGEAAVALWSRQTPLRIGLVTHDENSENAQNREAGLRDYLEQVENAEITAVVHVDSNVNSATAGALSLLYAHPEINLLIGLNEWSTLGVGNAIRQRELGDTVQAVGFDSNVVSIGMLETGEMDTLLVQNPFSMGYLGVQAAALLLSGKSAADTVTAVTAVTRDDMFEEKNQKILFQFE